MTQDVSLTKEALRYFSSPAFQKLFGELQRKFYHQGHFGKSIGFQKFSEAELTEIMHFMGISEWEWRKKRRISVSQLIQSYEESKFVELPFPSLIEQVMQKPLLSKQDILQKERQVYQQFERLLYTTLQGYATYLPEEKKKHWVKLFSDNQKALCVSLENVKKALDHLPQQFEKIPYFSYRLFHDPHRLDRTTVTGGLFFDYIEILSTMLTPETPLIGDTEWENLVYENVYLLKDDSYNAVQTNGLIAQKAGKEIGMWREAAQAKIAWNVPLKHILEVDQIVPFKGNKVLFVENSGVFSIICGRYPQLPVVCSSGQMRYSVWKIAEKLIASGVQIYYSGDLDPAGLHMAQKIVRRFGSSVFLWLMDEAAYRQVPKSVELSEAHLRQLGSIKVPQLMPVRDLMEKEKLAGYQEGLIEELFKKLAQW